MTYDGVLTALKIKTTKETRSKFGGIIASAWYRNVNGEEERLAYNSSNRNEITKKFQNLHYVRSVKKWGYIKYVRRLSFV
jgi:hypothetical protein